MGRIAFRAWWRQLRGSLRVLRGRITGSRRDIVAGHLDETVGRIAAAHARADQQVRRDLASWRVRNAGFLARHPRRPHPFR